MYYDRKAIDKQYHGISQAQHVTGQHAALLLFMAQPAHGGGHDTTAHLCLCSAGVAEDDLGQALLPLHDLHMLRYTCRVQATRPSSAITKTQFPVLFPSSLDLL